MVRTGRATERMVASMAQTRLMMQRRAKERRKRASIGECLGIEGLEMGFEEMDSSSVVASIVLKILVVRRGGWKKVKLDLDCFIYLLLDTTI